MSSYSIVLYTLFRVFSCFIRNSSNNVNWCITTTSAGTKVLCLPLGLCCCGYFEYILHTWLNFNFGFAETFLAILGDSPRNDQEWPAMFQHKQEMSCWRWRWNDLMLILPDPTFCSEVFCVFLTTPFLATQDDAPISPPAHPLPL